MQTAKIEDTLYDQLIQLPENLVGEIINGQLYTQPRPTIPHVFACSELEIEIGSAYQKGRGGPGGWWILVEPEVHFVRDIEVLVPDIAGWRRERMPTLPRDQRCEVTPDWVCEVLSPGTAKKDRATKMPVYARYGVPYLWLVDPLAHTLEAYTLESGRWMMQGVYSDETEARIPPFTDIALVLTDLWVET
jgi:Uma2 family endonuclease